MSSRSSNLMSRPKPPLLYLLGALLFSATFTFSLPAVAQTSARDLNNSGTEKLQKGDFAGAIADFSRAIDLNPKSAVYFYNRGGARVLKADFDGAIGDLSRAITLDPKNAHPSYNWRGLAKQSKGDLDGAISDYSRAIELSPTFDAAFYNRGVAKRAKGDLSGAAADAMRSIELDPESASAVLLNFGICPTKMDKGAVGSPDKQKKLDRELFETIRGAPSSRNDPATFREAARLLGAAANPNSPAQEPMVVAGYTPLMLATTTGQLQIIRLLAACGADLNAKSKDILVMHWNEKNPLQTKAYQVTGWTALMLAGMQETDETIELLLDLGALVTSASVIDKSGSAAAISSARVAEVAKRKKLRR